MKKFWVLALALMMLLSTASVYAADIDWEHATDEELYALAKEEPGDINIYAISSRMQKVADKFNETYPGLHAVAYDLDQDEAIAKVKIEAETGNVNADVLQCKDTAGEIYYDFYPLGYITSFFPADIVEKISNKTLLDYGFPFYSALNFWYYNTALYPDGAPVKSWWDIIEKDENGQQKFALITKEIGSEDTYLSLFSSFVLNADLMETDYLAKFGKPIEFTYDPAIFGTEPNNYGWEYIYRFTQMKMTFISDGDEVVEAVAKSTVPTLGFVSAGKITNRDENNWPIDWVVPLTPYTATQNSNYLYLISNNNSPAGGRLFIRFLMGGADGQSGGFDPFMKEGNWPIRSDVFNKKNPFAIEDAGAIVTNIKDVYDIILDVKDFWVYNLNSNPNM